jgi:hypothetical protein
MKHFQSLDDALHDLRVRGYEADFETRPFCLYCGVLGLSLNLDQYNIDEIYQFEGDFSADDHIIVYAISSVTGVKGTLVDHLECTPSVWEWQKN